MKQFNNEKNNTSDQMQKTGSWIISLCSFVLGILLIAGLGGCSSTSSTATTKFHFPQFETVVLENGATLYFVKDSSLPYMSLQALFDVGSSLDPAGKEGSAVLMFEMLKEGSKNRPGSKLKEAYSNLGTSLSVSVERDFASLRTKALSKYSDQATSLFVETITSPEFGKKEFERRRNSQVAELERFMESPQVFVSMLFYFNLFGKDHAYGMPVPGTLSAVKGMTLADIENFYKSYMNPSRMHIAISGLYSESSKQILMQKLGALKAHEGSNLKAKTFAQVKETPTKIIFVDKPNMAQAEVRIGYQSIKRNNPEFVKFQVANGVVAGGDFSSRLMQEARVKRGLVYGIHGSPQGLKEEGPIIFAASTRHEKISELLQVVLQQVESARLDGVTAKELKDQKATILGQLPRSFETTESYIARVMQYKLYGFDEDYLNTYIKDVASVSVKEASAILAKYYRNTGLQITILGSKASLTPDFEELGIPIEYKNYKSLGL